MKFIDFSKLNGQGNDFIIIDSTGNACGLPADLISSMCNRHFGIGADGLILVKDSEIADFFMDYYNHDGSQAEMCGNGIRCMARFLVEKNIWKKNIIKIDTRAGIKSIEMDIPGDKKKIGKIKVNMGRAIFEPGKIPVIFDKDAVIDKRRNTNEAITNYNLRIEDKKFNINCVSIGNPHCVIFMDDDTDLEKFNIDYYGPKIENNPIFPKKINVEFVKIKNDGLNMRVWERGVGETLACGTGACAAAVCSIRLGRIKESDIKVNLPGGKLNIYWGGKNSDIFLEGEVDYNFDGKYILE